MRLITPVEQEGARLPSSGVTVHLALVGSHQTSDAVHVLVDGAPPLMFWGVTCLSPSPTLFLSLTLSLYVCLPPSL